MSQELDAELRRYGTRFLLFAQAPVEADSLIPETVWVSSPPGSLAPGPADDRMYVVNPIAKSEPYELPYMPPYRGPTFAPPLPDPHGHFDYLEPGTEAFDAAHLFGAARRVLDIWEDFLGRPVEWHFARDFRRLELVTFVDWNNAHSGYGFLETGYGETDEGVRHPYCLNFDVIGHEVGHTIIYSTLGLPSREAVTTEYRGFQEASADLVALISAMHFDSVVDRVLHKSSGNLYSQNELNRIGELSETEQIRHASNEYKMSDVPDVTIPPDQLSQPDLHLTGEPLTGAGFDMIVELYQELLVERGLISRRIADLSYHDPHNLAAAANIQAHFDQAYRGRHDAFKRALFDARDWAGRIFATAWSELEPDFLTYRDVAAGLFDAERQVSDGRYDWIIEENLEWREIPFPRRGARTRQKVTDGYLPRFAGSVPYLYRWLSAQHQL